jgi:hypothetical protein
MSMSETPTADIVQELQSSDTPLHRTLFVEMTEQQQHSFIEHLQQQRFASYRKYEEAKAIKLADKNAKLTAQRAKIGARVEKLAADIEQRIEKLAAEVNKYTAATLLQEAEEQVDD